MPENQVIGQRVLERFTAGVAGRLGLAAFAVHLTQAGDLELSSIVVPRENRGQGRGSLAVEALARFADAHGVRVLLTPNRRDPGRGTTSRARLVRFYRRFGFVENKGRHKDFTTMAGMLREPRPATTAGLDADLPVALPRGHGR
jgi:GNAT superfamily N-acetyltransferase